MSKSRHYEFVYLENYIVSDLLLLDVQLSKYLKICFVNGHISFIIISPSQRHFSASTKLHRRSQSAVNCIIRRRLPCTTCPVVWLEGSAHYVYKDAVFALEHAYSSGYRLNQPILNFILTLVIYFNIFEHLTPSPVLTELK